MINLTRRRVLKGFAAITALPLLPLQPSLAATAPTHTRNALEIYGQHLKAVNAKDGLFPTDTMNLGRETPLGEGKVDFPRFLRRLKELGYTAPIIIEREISGPQLLPDLRQAKAYLERLLSETP